MREGEEIIEEIKEYKKRGRKPKESEERIDVTNPTDVKMFWLDIKNVEMIKSYCRTYGIDFRNATEEQKTNAYNFLKEVK